MDVLTDVLTAAQVGRPHSVRTVGRAPWAIAFERSPSAHFHIVIQGTCCLTMAGEPTTRTLTPGDVVLLPRGAPHMIGDTAQTLPVPIESLPVCLSPGQAAPLLEVGGAGPPTILMCGAYLMDPTTRPHPLLGALPEAVHLPGGRGVQPQLSAAVDLLATELQQPRPGGTTIVEALINALLAYILRAWCEEQPERSPAWAALTDPFVPNLRHRWGRSGHSCPIRVGQGRAAALLVVLVAVLRCCTRCR